MPVCQVCQKDNPAGVEYCEDCGAALTPAAPSSTAQAAAPAGPTSASASAPSPAPAAPSTSDTPPSPAGTAPSSAAPAAGESAPTAAPAAPAPGAAPPATPETQAAGAATPGTEKRARLVAMRYGAPTGEEIPLLGQRLVVGRFDPETGPVDIDLSALAEAVHVSRQHGELYREADGRWVVRDLGSANGVFVKGSGDPSYGPRITAPRPLSDGDELAFGNARFVFRTE